MQELHAWLFFIEDIQTVISHPGNGRPVRYQYANSLWRFGDDGMEDASSKMRKSRSRFHQMICSGIYGLGCGCSFDGGCIGTVEVGIVSHGGGYCWTRKFFHTMQPPPPLLWSPNAVCALKFEEFRLVPILFQVLDGQWSCWTFQDKHDKTESYCSKYRMRNGIKSMPKKGSPPEKTLAQVVWVSAPLPNPGVAPCVSVARLESILL